VRGTHRRRIHAAPWHALPDGAFVLLEAGPALVLDRHIVPWTREGYRGRLRRPARGTADMITPPSSVAAMQAGYAPQIDASACA